MFVQSGAPLVSPTDAFSGDVGNKQSVETRTNAQGANRNKEGVKTKCRGNETKCRLNKKECRFVFTKSPCFYREKHPMLQESLREQRKVG